MVPQKKLRPKSTCTDERHQSMKGDWKEFPERTSDLASLKLSPIVPMATPAPYYQYVSGLHMCRYRS
jgi:hypothetical protein